MNHEHLKKHIAKYDYIEGPEAAERFEEGMKKLFSVPKSVVADLKPKPKPKQDTASKG